MKVVLCRKDKLMQIDGGYRYPSNQILLFLSLISLAVTAVVGYLKCLSLLQDAELLFGLEGTSMLASAYSPVGLKPPQGGLWPRLKWFFETQKSMTVRFDQRMFYGGLICLFLAYVVGTYAA